MKRMRSPVDRKQIHDAIHTILITEWDPIGVNTHPEARNEYDSYIGKIYRLLMGGADKVKMSDHLRRLEQDSMGSSGRDDERRDRVAEMLLTLAR
jgi:hypothetical protein